MSEWGSFATEFIGCVKCFEAVGAAFAKYSGRGIIEAQIVGEGGRIYAGCASGLYSGEEMFNFDYTLRDLIEPNICHPVQVAVLCEAIDQRAILTYTPHGERQDGRDEQRVTNLARYVGASMYSLSDEARVEVFRYLERVYCREWFQHWHPRGGSR